MMVSCVGCGARSEVSYYRLINDQRVYRCPACQPRLSAPDRVALLVMAAIIAVLLVPYAVLLGVG